MTAVSHPDPLHVPNGSPRHPAVVAASFDSTTASPPRSGTFPLGVQWEVNEANSRRWYRHRFWRLRHSDRFLERLQALDEPEIMLLILDLECYESLLDRSERGECAAPPPLWEYLTPGREAWGEVARMLRELGWNAFETGAADGRK